MCASYGLGGGPYSPVADFGLDPIDERESSVQLQGWLEESNGKANTTREQKRGVNLNPVIHLDVDRGSGQGRRVMDLAWWWFHVGGQPAKFMAFNSRDDALTTKWRAGFQRRALLPADWYMEGKKRWTLPGGQLFAMAAILAPRTLPGGGTGLSYSLVTRSGVGEASTIVTARGDSRMPLVLPVELHDEWLDPRRPGDDDLVSRVQSGSEEISRAMTAMGATLL